PSRIGDKLLDGSIAKMQPPAVSRDWVRLQGIRQTDPKLHEDRPRSFSSLRPTHSARGTSVVRAVHPNASDGWCAEPLPSDGAEESTTPNNGDHSASCPGRRANTGTSHPAGKRSL